MASKRTTIVRVGADLAKSVIQVHAVDASGGIVAARALSRCEFLDWCSKLPKGCTVAMEASCAAHHWARALSRTGLTPKLISPTLASPYRMEGKTGKTDANDAAAICEAASRPQMRFVPIKTPAQQSWLALHVLRDAYVKDRTAWMNRIRGMLSEFGVIFPVSTAKFRASVLEVLADKENELTPLARTAVRKCMSHFQRIDEQLAWCDERIRHHAGTDERAMRAMEVFGVGPVSASALVASVGDLTQFKNGRQFGAWLGLTPRTRSSGGIQRLGKITKRGDRYLRTLLIMGARSALFAAPGRDDPVSKWVVQLKDRAGWQKACVALANKNARILWGVLHKKSAHPQG